MRGHYSLGRNLPGLRERTRGEHTGVVKLVADPPVRDHIEERGGRVFIWPHGYRCCRVSTWVLETATEPPPDRDFELVHAADGFQVLATPGFHEPEELHFELDRRHRLKAYWNGQGWIG